MNKKKKRILVLTSTFPRWEDDNEPPFVHELAKRLTDGWEIHVLAPHTAGAAIYEMMDGVVVHRFRYSLERYETLAYEGGMLARLKQNPLRYFLIPFFFIAQYLTALRIIRRFHIDIIHSHWLIPQGVVAVAVKMTIGRSIPVLCTSHGADLFSLKGRIFTLLKKLVFKKGDLITVVSNAMRIEAVRLGANPDRLAIIPMGVDVKVNFVPGPEKRDQDTVVFVGRLVEKKGLSYLLDAFPLAQEVNPNIRLVIAGAGPEEASLKEQASDLGVDNQVEFLGAVQNSELPAIYRRAAIAVFPFVVASDGDQEGFGLVVVEALGCGCAVIASEVSAVRDIITHEENGLLVQPEGIRQLASAIIDLNSDVKLCSRLASNGRAMAMKQFGWDSIAKRYSNLLETLNVESRIDSKRCP